MPKVGREFVARGGTIFSWYIDDSDTPITVIPSGGAEMIGGIHIPREDLNEFVAYLLSDKAVLLFPIVQKNKQ